MKIAYMILCHVDPKHIGRLVRKITYGTQNEAFIHVDGKVDATQFEKELADNKAAHFENKRFCISWGDIRQLKQPLFFLSLR